MDQNHLIIMILSILCLLLASYMVFTHKNEGFSQQMKPLLYKQLLTSCNRQCDIVTNSPYMGGPAFKQRCVNNCVSSYKPEMNVPLSWI